MNESIFILKGNIVYSKSQTELLSVNTDILSVKTAKWMEFTRRFRFGWEATQSGITATA